MAIRVQVRMVLILIFFKSCWDIIHHEVLEFVEEFYHNALLPKVVTSSILTLIPKKDHPRSPFEYRPISFIGSVDKIISKLLALRLKKVLGSVISSCQYAFLLYRQIKHGVLVVNKVVALAKRRKDSCFLLKIDFEKAYNSVSWKFLDYVLGKLSFDGKWRS